MRSEYPCMTDALRNAEKLMRLQAESPARMRKAVRERRASVGLTQGPVHRLEEEMPEVERGVPLGLGALLRVYQLELVARAHSERRLCLRAHAYPVELGRRIHRAIGLDRDFEPRRVQCPDQRRIELKERLASGADHERPRGRIPGGPWGGDGRGQRVGRGELAAAGTVRADELRVAEPAHGLGPILLPARPQV